MQGWRKSWMGLLLGLCSLFCRSPAFALDSAAPWMRADWVSLAPHLADAGVDPKALGAIIGNRLLMFRHAPREAVLPGPQGLRHFSDARYVSAVARVDIPAAQVQGLLRDFGNYRKLFPLMTASDVQTADGANVVSTYRLVLPLPVAKFQVGLRVKNRIEADGSILSMLVDGEAESVLAALGGFTDTLNSQPAELRWEVFPLDAQHALIALTFWNRVELKSGLALKVAAQYPEIREVGTYLFAAGALEALRSKFTTPPALKETAHAPGYAELADLLPLIDRVSANGQVVVLYPEPTVRAAGSEGSLRYVSVMTPIHRDLDRTVDLATQFSRMPEVLPEVRKIAVTPRGPDVNLDLNLRLGVSVLDFPLDVSLLNHRAAPGRMEFWRTGGQVARINGALEWRAQGAGNTLMVATTAEVLGDKVPWLLRKFYKIMGPVPYAGALSLMTAQQIALLRLRHWAELQPAPVAGR